MQYQEYWSKVDSRSEYGEQVTSITRYTGHSSHIFTFSWSPDGTRIAFNTIRNGLQVWSTQTRKIISTYNVYTDTVECIAWSPNGAYIATGNDNGVVRIWRAST